MRLKRINLRLAVDHNCPGVRCGRTTYLARIGGRWCVGTFSREWYGLNFDSDSGDFGAGLQFDAPGSNSSEWQELYQLIR